MDAQLTALKPGYTAYIAGVEVTRTASGRYWIERGDTIITDVQIAARVIQKIAAA